MHIQWHALPRVYARDSPTHMAQVCIFKVSVAVVAVISFFSGHLFYFIFNDIQSCYFCCFRAVVAVVPLLCWLHLLPFCSSPHTVLFPIPLSTLSTSTRFPSPITLLNLNANKTDYAMGGVYETLPLQGKSVWQIMVSIADRWDRFYLFIYLFSFKFTLEQTVLFVSLYLLRQCTFFSPEQHTVM